MDWSTLLLGMFLGFVLLPVIYNAGLYAAMRERFLVWHSARLIAMAVMALVGTEIFLGAWLADPALRNHIKLFALDIGIAMTGPFLVAYVEAGKLGPRLRRALLWSPVAVLAVTFLPLLAPDQPVPNAIRHLVFVGLIALYVSGSVQALRRGSRAARYQSAAWSVIIVVSIVAVGHELAFNAEWPLWHHAILVGLAIEVVVSAIGVSDRFMGLRRERDEAIAREALFAQIAATDSLTGLPNRRGLQARLRDAGAPLPSAVAVVDLDHFKRINDSHGHAIGDRVLKAAASALVHDDIFAARVGGEEFALLLYGADPLADADAVRQRIAEAVKVRIAEIAWPVSASIGVCPVAGRQGMEAAMRKADEALYRAKQAGRDRTVALPMAGEDAAADEASRIAA